MQLSKKCILYTGETLRLWRNNMPYQYFPTTLYNDILVTDLLKKFKVADRVKKTIAVENYRVKEEDTPETLAYLLYQDTTLSWMILMLNEIRDRNHEWPYKYETLNKIISENYNTSSIFLRDNQINFSLTKATRFTVGNDSYDIKSINRDINRITTKEKIPTSVLQNQAIVFYNNDTRLHTGNKTIGKVVYEDTAALHHFEDADGNILDPRGIANLVPYTETQTYLYKYIIGDDLTFAVSNFQNELNTNDKKRDIILLNPEYKQLFLAKLSRLFLNTNKDINVLDDIDIRLLNE